MDSLIAVRALVTFLSLSTQGTALVPSYRFPALCRASPVSHTITLYGRVAVPLQAENTPVGDTSPTPIGYSQLKLLSAIAWLDGEVRILNSIYRATLPGYLLLIRLTELPRTSLLFRYLQYGYAGELPSFALQTLSPGTRRTSWHTYSSYMNHKPAECCLYHHYPHG